MSNLAGYVAKPSKSIFFTSESKNSFFTKGSILGPSVNLFGREKAPSLFDSNPNSINPNLNANEQKAHAQIAKSNISTPKINTTNNVLPTLTNIPSQLNHISFSSSLNITNKLDELLFEILSYNSTYILISESTPLKQKEEEEILKIHDVENDTDDDNNESNFQPLQ